MNSIIDLSYEEKDKLYQEKLDYFIIETSKLLRCRKSALKELISEHDWTVPIGIVEVEKNGKYYQEVNGLHGYEKVKTRTFYSNMRITYLVRQTCGYLGDDYAGYLLFPMKDGRYYKVEYLI